MSPKGLYEGQGHVITAKVRKRQQIMSEASLKLYDDISVIEDKYKLSILEVLDLLHRQEGIWIKAGLEQEQEVTN